ncbi:MAG: glycosyltransferase family 39 protein, partial [Saprospiraceae bacterium]|nr:glycosyltransferase family 39 protein [Saprospiraceae bacterium]
MRENPFFWDTVQLASKHGHHFYETNFQSFILPNEIDSGHPPIFGAYLALAWKLFGKTLPVSHFAMLPFIFGIVILLMQIGKKLLGEKNAVWLPLLSFADPVLASQSILVSPDIIVVCFFLASVWAIWQKKPWLLTIGITVLALVSMRGMMLCTALFAFAFITSPEKLSLKNVLKHSLPFLPGVILAVGYL